MSAADDRHRRIAAACVLVAVAALSAWSLEPTFAQEPAVAVGYWLIDVGFTATALLLMFQEDQVGNAKLTGLVAASSLASHLTTKSIGQLTPIAYVFGSLTLVLAAAVILRYPRRYYCCAERWWVAVNLPLAAVFGVLVMVTGRPEWSNADPANWWPNPFVSPELNRVVLYWRSWWRVLAAASFLGLVVWRWRRLGRLERRTLMPIIIAAVLGAALVAADLVQWWVPTVVSQGIVTLRSYTGAMVSLAFVASALVLRMARSAVADLAAEMARPTTPGQIRTALRSALSDPTLEIAYWVADRGGYVDGEGRPFEATHEGSSALVVHVNDRDGEPLAIIRADRSLRRHRQLVDAAVAVSALALENVRLQAGLRAQLAEVTATRARLLQSGFEQRRQLERDLHDGAQQRLLAIGMRLAALESQSRDQQTRDAVVAAKSELNEALAELRDLAHGLYPVVLSQGGLAAALEAVAERLPLVVHLDVPPRRWPADMEGVAYLVASEALANVVKHAQSPTADVTVADRDDVLEVTVTDHGHGWASGDGTPTLPGLADRLAALGGSLRIGSGHTGTVVAARIPNTGTL